ncbi:MAG: hypothetical protein JXA87_12470 [Thermoleophilia bacterium]|nr:hypothetical protein [Thermoleophilia bacterium]
MIDGMNRAAAKMWADFEASRKIRHAAETGAEREASFVREWLGVYAPKRYSVINSGFVLSSHGAQSLQQDVLLYDDFMSPRLLPGESTQLVFVESTFCVTEVKSRLTKAETEDVAEKVASARSLQQTPMRQMTVARGLTIQAGEASILGAGFAFTSSSTLEQSRAWLRSAVHSTTESHWPSCLVILEDTKGRAGLVVSLDPKAISRITTLPLPDARFGVVECESKGEALLYFFLILMQHLRDSGTLTAGPDFMAYAKTSGLDEPRIHIEPDEMEGASAVIEDQSLDIDKAMRAQELTVAAQSQRATDEEIVELMGLLPLLPYGSYLGAGSVRVFFEGAEMDLPPFPEVLSALRAYTSGEANADTAAVAEKFLALFRAAMAGHGALEFR